MSEKINYYKGQTRMLRKRIDNLEKRIYQLEQTILKLREVLPEKKEESTNFKRSSFLEKHHPKYKKDNE